MVYALRMMPERLVVQAEARAWLAENSAKDGMSVVTSLPDLSEVPNATLETWRAWFIDTARQIIGWVPPQGVAIFYQSDIRHMGEWVDKGYLVLRAAEEAKAHLQWHSIVCRKPPGTLSFGRPSYSHMLCVSPTRREPAKKPGVDVLSDAGEMAWSRAMGLAACRMACRYLKENIGTETVVDPFCGTGSILKIANHMGMHSLGIDLSAKRCKEARRMGDISLEKTEPNS